MIELIEKRLKAFQAYDAIEEENALKEIIQEIMLYSLWRADFFEVAAFQGGTSLRILHNLPRFSEDMDFILLEPCTNFSWQPYLNSMEYTLKEFGIEPEILDKARMEQRVKKALIKEGSIANQLNMIFMDDLNGRKLKIKLEIDTNPPDGSSFDYTYLDFPMDYEVCHQDLSSNFALKIHALLCRKYLKGRDWYDFSWYVSQKTKPNLMLLQNAILQDGPWKGQELNTNQEWLLKALKEKIISINWKEAVIDVQRFIKERDQKSLKLWSERFFINKLGQLF